MALTRITKGVIKPNENYDTHNINSTGIITAIGFKGPFTGSSDIQSGILTATKIDLNGDIDVDGHTNLDNVNVAGVTTFAANINGTNASLSGSISAATANFTGNVTIGGTLTYEDVTNIDAVGLVTARKGVVSPYADIDDWIDVGNNIQLGNAGVATATLFNATTGVFAPYADIDDWIDVGSHIQLGNAGIVTAKSADINGDIDVDGHTNLDNVSIAGVTTFSDTIRIADSKKILLGNLAAGDCQFIHDGSDTFIQNKTGDLKIANNVAGDVGGNIIIQAMNGENSINCVHDAQVELAFNGTKRFETTNTGAIVTGISTATSGFVSKNDGSASIDLKLVSGATWGLRSYPTSGSNSYGFGIYKGAAGTDLKLVITSTGVVSINDSTPETFATLQVKNHSGSNAAQFLLHGADMAQIILRDDTGGTNTKCTTIRNDQGAFLVGTHNDSYGGFSEKLRIASSGELTMTSAATKTFLAVNTTNNTTRGLISLQGKDASGNVVTLKMGGFGDTSRGEIFTHSNHGLGFATNNAATQMMLDTSGRLRVGNTNANADGAFDNLIVGNYSGHTGISVLSGSSSQGAIGFAKSGAMSDGYVAYNHNSTATNSSMVIKSSGTIQFDTGGTSNRLRIDSSGRTLIGHNANLSEGCLLQVARTNDNTVELFGFSANANGARINFTKSRNGTIGSNTIVQDDDTIGELHFRAANGSGYYRVAAIEAEMDGTISSSSLPGRLVFSTTALNATTQTPRLTITSGGQTRINPPADNGGSSLLDQQALIGTKHIYTAYHNFSSTNSSLDVSSKIKTNSCGEIWVIGGWANGNGLRMKKYTFVASGDTAITEQSNTFASRYGVGITLNTPTMTISGDYVNFNFTFSDNQGSKMEKLKIHFEYFHQFRVDA